MSIVTIRKATTADLDKLIQVRLDYLKANIGLTHEDEETILLQLTSYFNRELNRNLIAYLAEENKLLVSAALMVLSERPANPYFITGKIATVLNVYTYPAYRRKGFATLVIKELVNEAKMLDISYLELSATDQGLPLYEKLGFTIRKSNYTEMRLQLIPPD